MFAPHQRLHSMFFVCLMTFMLTGCSTLNSWGGKQLPATPDRQTPPEHFTVEVHPGFGSPKTIKGTLTGPMTVQSAIEASGAIKSLRGMEIEVLRRVPESGQMARLPVTYDAATKAVKMHQDYAIHANDRIIVRQQSNSPLDKVVTKFFGEL